MVLEGVTVAMMMQSEAMVRERRELLESMDSLKGELEMVGKAFDVLCQSISPDVIAPLLAELYDVRGIRDEVAALHRELAELRQRVQGSQQ